MKVPPLLEARGLLHEVKLAAMTCLALTGCCGFATRHERSAHLFASMGHTVPTDYRLTVEDDVCYASAGFVCFCTCVRSFIEQHS